LFLQEVAHRNGVPKDLLAFSTPSELMSLLKTGSINLETLENRAKQPFFAFSTPQGSEFLYGENVDAVYKKMYPNLETSEEKNLKGVQASRGKASGNVRVILKPSEFERMRDGDVLVTTMTRPEFVPLMKKASAILTDEGGITSHASIVSRELGKPCIIGTKIATQILKDGDFVEVDADNGVVRVIG